MIAIVNAEDEAFGRGAAAALAKLLPARHVPAIPPPEEGGGDFVVSRARATADEIHALRAGMAKNDPTIYAFLALSGGPSRAALRELERGDPGYPVSGPDPEAVARRIEGLIREPVRIVEYDPAWPREAAEERLRILDAMRGIAVEVHPIGSTAVEGLPAKPIVDLAVEVDRLDRPSRAIARLRPLGYHFFDYPGADDRWFFARGEPRSHHVHVMASGSRELMDHLDFRDALRADASWRRRYAALKRDAAARFARERARYGEVKGAFIREVLRAYRARSHC